MENNQEAINIIIGGDISPKRQNIPLFKAGDANGIFADYLPDITNADYSIINLEGPFVSEPSPIEKTGPIFGIGPDCTKGFTASNIKCFNLANNHIMDHGRRGLEFTIQTCINNNIAYVGAGKDLEEANKILKVKIKDKTVGFYSMADHEFSIASRDSWGANPTDVINYIKTVRENKDQIDHLIVLLHEGIQHYPYPSPRMQRLCRFMIDEGASVVICQHSHCPGCYEYYKNGVIVYGQGDLIMESKNLRTDLRGFLVKLLINSENSIKLEILPYKQVLDTGGIAKMNPNEEILFNKEIELRNQILGDIVSLEENWQEYCNNALDGYWSLINGHGRIMHRLNRIFHLSRYAKISYLKNILNLTRCAAHREIIETMFIQKISEIKKDNRLFL